MRPLLSCRTVSMRWRRPRLAMRGLAHTSILVPSASFISTRCASPLGATAMKVDLASAILAARDQALLLFGSLALGSVRCVSKQLDFVEGIDEVRFVGHAFEQGVELGGVANGGGTRGNVVLAEFGQETSVAIAEVVEALRISARDARPMQIAVDDEADFPVDLHGLGLGVVD